MECDDAQLQPSTASYNTRFWILGKTAEFQTAAGGNRAINRPSFQQARICFIAAATTLLFSFNTFPLNRKKWDPEGHWKCFTFLECDQMTKKKKLAADEVSNEVNNGVWKSASVCTDGTCFPLLVLSAVGFLGASLYPFTFTESLYPFWVYRFCRKDHLLVEMCKSVP